MISFSFTLMLWGALIGLDLSISILLARMYRRDSDIRKLMFIIALLFCLNIYAIAIVGANSFPQANNILEWAPLPLLLAFIFTSLHERFNVDVRKCYRFFMIGVFLTIVLFIVPLPVNSSPPILLVGLAVALTLMFVQHLKRFDLPMAILFCSMPCFAVSYYAIGQNMIELAIFSGFAAEGSLFIAFEVSKYQEGDTSSILVLKKELYTAEHNFNKLFNIIPDPVAIIDAKGFILAVSPKIFALSGYGKEELLGRNFLKIDLISNESKFRMMQNLGVRVLGYEIPPYEIEVQTKDGKRGQYEINTSRITFRGKPATVVVFRDLTERNRLIREIEREKTRFQDIAKSTGDWIWELDSEGKFIYSNSVVEKVIGYSSEEIMGKKACEVFTSATKDEKESFPESILGKGCMSSSMNGCFHRDGRCLTLETHIMSIYNINGKLVGHRGVSRDFTEKKEMEKRLLKAERFVAIGEMSTMIAHDLRNPLQGISNTVHYLKKVSTKLGNERLASVIPLINEALKHADKIIRELLDYSANIKLELKESDSKSIVKKALSGLIFPENIRLIEEYGRNHRIRVDPEKIRRVIVNLVSNAFDAMPNGGILTIVSKEAKGKLELSVADNGTGIPDQKMDKLWSPFVTTKAKGIGLGLPICKRIIDAHGGEILCKSNKGKGTVFTLVLPIVESKNEGVEFCVDERDVVDSRSNYSSIDG